MGIAQDIAEQYPFLAFLANDSQVGPILRKAVDVNTPYSEGKFTAEIMKTRWWRKQADAKREWEILRHTRPGEAKHQLRLARSRVQRTGQAFGTSLTKNQRNWLAMAVVQGGMQWDDPRITDFFIKTWSWQDRHVGQVGEALSHIRQINNEYFDRPTGNIRSRRKRDRDALRIAAGRDTLEAYRQRKQMGAFHRFPHMKEALAQGLTPQQVVAPLQEIVAEEMGFANPEQVNVLKNPRYRKLLYGVRDPKTKKTRMMTDSDVTRLVRTDPKWWQTANGKAADSEMASTLLELFGERKRMGVG